MKIIFFLQNIHGNVPVLLLKLLKTIVANFKVKETVIGIYTW